MNTHINLYDLLGVKPDADEAEIKRAYRKLATKTHPDVGGESMASLFMGIQKAYETLSDPALRADYDASLNSPQKRTETPERQQKQSHRAPNKEAAPPSYDWEWAATIIPTNGIALFAKAAKEDGKRFVKERYVQRFPFTAIFWAALSVWLVSLMLRNASPVPEALAATPMTKLMGGLQLAHIVGVAVPIFSKKLKAMKSIIAALIGLLPLLAPTIINVAVTRSPDFIPPSPLTLIATITLVVSATAIIWSLYEQGQQKLKLKAAGIPRRVSDWNMINLSRRKTDHAAARHAETIGEMIASKLPGTKMFMNLPVRNGERIPLLMLNGNRAAIIDVMDTSAIDLPDDITTYRWDEFKWEESSLGDKPLVLRRALPSHIEVRSFLMVYPAHTGAHAASYAIGQNTVQVHAVSDVELGNIMGAWLADGKNVGAVDKDAVYTLMTGRSLSTLR